ncbi:MAG: hypothetical protein FJ083_00845 [Cyanobacteria bacterium K_Offshore_surface_m2_239]|nr:hypothetical protein [Cyanobacteria bacterium K_Offshore_surface_m2_239]
MTPSWIRSPGDGIFGSTFVMCLDPPTFLLMKKNRSRRHPLRPVRAGAAAWPPPAAPAPHPGTPSAAPARPARNPFHAA